MYTEHQKRTLKPFSVSMAIRERAQKEDEVRWGQAPHKADLIPDTTLAEGSRKPTYSFLRSIMP